MESLSGIEILYQPSEQFDLLQGFGVAPKIAEHIDKLHQGGLLPGELSDQVIDAFREMPEHQAMQVLTTFKTSNLSTINNRSAFLLGLIKQSYKTKPDPSVGSTYGMPDQTGSFIPGLGSGASLASSGDHYAVQESELGFASQEEDIMDYDAGYMSASGTVPGANGMYGMQIGGMSTPQQTQGMYGGFQGEEIRERPMRNGPNAEALSQILARTGYPHEVTPSLRRYGGPPPDWTGPKPTQGVEVFLGRLPEDLYEDELIPLMEKCGKIYELRVIVDREGYNRGFGFVTFCDKESAKNAVNTYNNFRIRGRRIVANLNVQFTKLYVGGIPKDKTREQIFSAFSQEVDKLTDVVIQEPEDMGPNTQNRGFCFLEFDGYFDAAAARRKLMNGRSCIRAWDNYRKFKVDWAIPLENPDETVANRSTVILVTKLNDSVNTSDLHEKFGKYGSIKSCNKTGQHAFITFSERNSAESAVESENHQFIKDVQMEVSIHVPLTDIAKRMVEAIKGPRGGASMGVSYGGGQRGGGSFRGGRGQLPSMGSQYYGMGGNNPGLQRRGGFHQMGGGRGGRGRGDYREAFNPLERAGSFTRARMMNRRAGMFSDRGGGVQSYNANPYALQRGSGVFKHKQRGSPGMGMGMGGRSMGSMHGGQNVYAVQNTYSQLGSSFTQF